MASLKTDYLVREVVLDTAVNATVNTTDAAQTALSKAFQIRQTTPAALTAMKVGDLVVLTPATATLPASIVRTLSLAAATHLVVQSDNTMGYGHIPVENRDYRYFPMVNGTYTGSLATTSPAKKVAVIKIDDRDNILIDASQGETL